MTNKGQFAEYVFQRVELQFAYLMLNAMCLRSGGGMEHCLQFFVFGRLVAYSSDA